MKKIILTIALLFTFSIANDYKKFPNWEQLQFNEVNLLKKMKELGIKFPDIVLAQAKIETGHFKSKIFKKNNNLFGMKLARKRQTTAIGEQFNHAMYQNWVQSVIDYKIWQDKYASKFKTKDLYLNYLSDIYSENDKYINLIKKML